MHFMHTDNNAHSDDESLFGSPPPSPGGGIPTLALPSAGLNSEQNVGTLALPGLHNFSELAVSPVAVPLDGNCQPKPAQLRLYSIQRQPCNHSASVSSSSPRPPSTTSRTVQKKKRSRENSATPRLDQPSIKLPDLNAPLPPNFLRNQQALLGLAGVVGGVNPANLSLLRHTRGTNAQNPIIVEDEHDPPLFGHHYGRRTAPINPSRLSTPSPAQVFSTLVNQKNIFPVLESIFKLIRSDSPYATTSETLSSADNDPPVKRRRMTEVPAGAADWDAPYPFPSGEGPKNYKGDWAKERGKQLIFQLIDLIGSAAEKAATKGYAQKQNLCQSLSNANGNYRSLTAAYGDSSQPSYNSYLPSANTPHPATPLDQLVGFTYGPDCPHPASSNAPSIDLSDLEDLISLLNDTIPEQGGPEPSSPSANPVFPACPPIPDSLIDPVLLGLSMPNLERYVASAPSSTVGRSTPALAGSPIPSSGSVMDPVTPSSDMHVFPELDVACGDPGAYFRRNSSLYESLMRRRLVSDGVASDVELGVKWGGDTAQESLGPFELSSASLPVPLSDVPLSCDTRTVSTSTNPNCSGFGSPRTASQFTAVPTTSIQPSRRRPQPVSAKRMATSNTPHSTPSVSANATKQRREQLIQRANEMRRQLVGEIGKSKVELWEMTIEQGGLAHLAKDDALS